MQGTRRIRRESPADLIGFGFSSGGRRFVVPSDSSRHHGPAVLILLPLCAEPSIALPGDQIIPGVLTGAGAPYTITSCEIGRTGSFFWNGVTVTLTNRTAHAMLSDMTLCFSTRTMLRSDNPDFVRSHAVA